MRAHSIAPTTSLCTRARHLVTCPSPPVPACRRSMSQGSECLTTPHTLALQQERARVAQAAGKRVDFVQVQGGAFMRVRQGPGQGQEVTMTRALGHRALAHYGIVPEPDVVLGEFTESDTCVVELAWGTVW